MDNNKTAFSTAFTAKGYADANYKIEYHDDGVYANVRYESGDGQAILPQFLLFDLERRGIKGVNPGDVIVRLRRQETPIRLADIMEEQKADATFAVRLYDNNMKASMMTFEPVLDGAELAVENARAQLESQWKVVHGVDEKIFEMMIVDRHFLTEVIIAQGTPAQDGKDAEVTLLFETEHTFAPKIDEKGNANYKDLDLFADVKAGDPLARLSPETPGEKGMTVAGKELLPKSGRKKRLPLARGASLSEDGLELIADKSGRAEYVMGRIEVLDTFEIKGDADIGIGNIDFKGDVIVRGNIISELTIQAEGSIEVYGVVEAAHLIAGQDIILRSGIQGKDRGSLKAGGNIAARFIERAIVSAEGDLSSESIVHSRVQVGGNIHMPGSRTRIIGGHIVAGESISVHTVGSLSNDQTVVEVRGNPILRAQKKALTHQQGDLTTQLERIDATLESMPVEEAEIEQQPMLLKLAESRELLAENLRQITAILQLTEQRLGQMKLPKIHAFGEMMPYVRIIIHDLVYHNEQSVEYATFLIEEGEVVFTSSQISADGG